MTVAAVADGVCTVQFDHVRVFVIEGRPAGMTTLVDAAFPDDDHELVSMPESEFGSANRFVITHGDEGHFGGTPAVLGAFDPELFVPGGVEGFYDALDIETDRHFRHDDAFDGRTRIVQVPDCAVVGSGLLLKDDGVFVVGDVIGGSDRRGLPPGLLAPPMAQFNDPSHERTERSLVKLFDYDIETALMSHGTHVDDNPLGKLDN